MRSLSLCHLSTSSSSSMILSCSCSFCRESSVCRRGRETETHETTPHEGYVGVNQRSPPAHVGPRPQGQQATISRQCWSSDRAFGSHIGISPTGQTIRHVTQRGGEALNSQIDFLNDLGMASDGTGGLCVMRHFHHSLEGQGALIATPSCV